MIYLTEKVGHGGYPLLQLALERAQDRLLGDDIDYHLECEQHHQQQADGLRRQTDANPPYALVLCRRGTVDSARDPGPADRCHYAVIQGQIRVVITP
jgi:hypothetical protein